MIYNCELNTKYFHLSLNILIEEFPDLRDTEFDTVECLRNWFEEFSKDEFAELRDALDGLVYCVPMDSSSVKSLDKQLEIVAQIKELLDEEPFYVVVGSAKSEVKPELVEEVEDEVIMNGFEFVDLNENGSNEFMEKVGKNRLLEIFETHLWSDMDKVDLPEEKYVSHKRDKIADMTKGLLEVEDADQPEKEIDLERLMQKLRVDKDKVDQLKEEEKKDYVDSLVQEYLEFF